MHPRAEPVAVGPHGDGVVEVLCGLRVDREGGQVAQVDAAVEARLGQLVRLELGARAVLDEEPLEHGLDRLRGPEHALDARAAATGDACDHEVAGARVAHAVPVEDDRRPRREERLADDELPRRETSTTTRSARSPTPRPSCAVTPTAPGVQCDP